MIVLSRIDIARRKNGFTLLELTITVMITGILAAVAVPVYSNNLLRFRVDVAAQRIAQDVALAQKSAIQNSSTRTITFAGRDDSCAVSGISSLDRASQPYKVSFNQPPYQVDVSSLVNASEPTTPLATVSVVFNRFGMPDKGISVTVRAGPFQKRVDVAPISGRISIQ